MLTRTPEEWARLADEDTRAEAAAARARTRPVTAHPNNWGWDRIIAQVIDPARTIAPAARKQYC